MERFIALLKRFENKDNEELFPICSEQIAEIYVNDPDVFSVVLFHKLKDFLIHKMTYKRLIAAALFEKIV